MQGQSRFLAFGGRRSCWRDYSGPRKLRRKLRRFAQLRQKPALNCRSLSPPPDEWHKPASRIMSLKRRPKRVQIARLYPQRPSESSRHARALLNFIGEECPDFIGSYIPKTDLERTYRELCVAEWMENSPLDGDRPSPRLHDEKVRGERGGIRFVAYQIPRTQFR